MSNASPIQAGGDIVPTRLQCDNLYLQTAASWEGRGPKSSLPIITSLLALPAGPAPAATSEPLFLISRPSCAALVTFFQDESWL